MRILMCENGVLRERCGCSGSAWLGAHRRTCYEISSCRKASTDISSSLARFVEHKSSESTAIGRYTSKRQRTVEMSLDQFGLPRASHGSIPWGASLEVVWRRLARSLRGY